MKPKPQSRRGDAFGPNSRTDARDRILEAAVNLFFEHGFVSTTIRQITTACGLTPGALYNHFKSKEELLLAIALDAQTRVWDCVSSAREAGGADPAAQLSNMVRAFVLFHLTHQRAALTASSEYRWLSGNDRKRNIANRRRLRSAFAEVVQSGVNAGVFESGLSPSQINIVVMSLLNMGIRAARWYEPGAAQSAEAVADLHAWMAVRIVSAGGAPPPTG